MCSQGYVLNKYDFFTSDDQISQSSGNSYSLIPSRSPTYTTTETLINNMPVLSNNIENEKEKNCIMEIEPMSQKKNGRYFERIKWHSEIQPGKRKNF